MFRKLLSNLPFNPSLIHQVAFYAKRLRREEGLRRTGLVLVALSMVVQMFAAFAPAEASLRGSDNDILRGGFSSKSDAVNKCRNNTQDFRTILEYYHVSCDNVAGAADTSLNSLAHNRELDSLGRIDYGDRIPRTGKPTNRYTVPIGGTTYHMRNLWAWDSGGSSTYRVLRMSNREGAPIYILFNCGNIVTVGRYTPPNTPPPPPPQNAPASVIQVQACDVRNRRIHFGGYAFDGDRPSASLSVTLFIDGNRIDNYTANVSRPDVNSYFNISGNHGFDINPPNPSQYMDNRSHTAYVTAAGINAAGQQDGNNRRSATVTFGPCQITETPPPPPPTTPPPPTDACPYPEYPGNQQSASECAPCEESTSPTDSLPCLSLSKRARNNTQDIDNAHNKKAAAGDSITYTLTVKNNGKIAVNNFVIEENLADVLEYTEEVMSLDGGTMGDDKVVRWSAVTVAPGDTISKEITLRIKKTIPTTPSPPSNPGSFDLIMTNVYGNAVHILLPGSVVKRVETATKNLPNTGPGTTVAIAAGITVFASYFFARSHLMAKELDIVREEYVSTGGA